MTMYSIASSSGTWINIERPTTADVTALQAAYPYIHPLNIEDIHSSIERPKLDENEHYLFAVLHFPRWDAVNRLSRAEEVDIFVGRDFIITIHDGVLDPLKRLFDSAQQDATMAARLLGDGMIHAFYTIVDQLVDDMFPLLRRVDGNLRHIEDTIFVDDSRDIIRDIALVRRDIIALRRIIRQQVPIIESLEARVRFLHDADEDFEEYFGDVVDHIHHARDIIDENAEVIGALADTADRLISNRVNEVIRILTVFSVIVLPLTLLSSIYGMNIEGLPFADHPYSFLIVNGIMVGIALLMLLYFRLRHWL